MAWPYRDGFLVRNYLIGTTLGCAGPALALLARADRWQAPDALVRTLADLGDESPGDTLLALLRNGALVPEGTRTARRENEWLRSWKWGPVAAAFHRGLRDLRFRTEEETAALLSKRAKGRPPPAVIPEPGPRRLSLPPPRTDRGLLARLLLRESVREMSGAPISSRQLAEVLFAGLGVRAVVRDPIQGDLPLKLAPSGGARNPIDGYLVAIDVAGVPPGAYRYSGLRRDLEPVGRPPPLPAAAELLGGQPWAKGVAAVVFLVASLGRAMWKYEHPLSLRMVLLEAGHVAQNMLVAASDLGLASWPSGAISDSRVEDLLGIGGPDRAVLYAVVLGRPTKAPRQRPSLALSSPSSRSGGKPGSASRQKPASKVAAARASGSRPLASSARARRRRPRG
ncbi:MAG: SagB/ThcOx family dehydrogenase [Anaeromyxobacteraceae bacterium]